MSIYCACYAEQLQNLRSSHRPIRHSTLEHEHPEHPLPDGTVKYVMCELTCRQCYQGGVTYFTYTVK